MEAAAKADPKDPAAERGLASIPWMMISFRRGAVTVDEYLGGVTRQNVAMREPPADLASRFGTHRDRSHSPPRTSRRNPAIPKRTTRSARHWVCRPPISPRLTDPSSARSAPRGARTTSARPSSSSIPPARMPDLSSACTATWSALCGCRCAWWRTCRLAAEPRLVCKFGCLPAPGFTSCFAALFHFSLHLPLLALPQRPPPNPSPRSGSSRFRAAAGEAWLGTATTVGIAKGYARENSTPAAVSRSISSATRYSATVPVGTSAASATVTSTATTSDAGTWTAIAPPTPGCVVHRHRGASIATLRARSGLSSDPVATRSLRTHAAIDRETDDGRKRRIPVA